MSEELKLPNPTQYEIERLGKVYYGLLSGQKGKIEAASAYINVLRQKKVYQSHQITGLEAERDALRDTLEALVIANEFELPAIRDGEKTNERLDILSRCTREARTALSHDGRA